ncbi:MAG TPA: AMP-binding protein [Acidimicrobiales bacterium]|nr:AMP-binding protein [Acidimicrobiales bacterium]
MTSTLPQRIEAACETGAATFVTADSAERVPWSRLHEDARATAVSLAEQGVAPGDHVALLGTSSRAMVTAVQATWLAGATVVILPLPLRLGSLEDFVVQTRKRLAAARARVCLVEPALAGVAEQGPDDPPLIPLDQVVPAPGGGAGRRSRRAERFAPVSIDPEAVAIVQFTSGSTADPKGVILPHARVGANLDAITQGVSFAPDDVTVSWLPLYHDMGLIGCLTVPMVTGTDLVLASPQDFMAAPSRWMEWMSAYRGTCTAGPNFAYALAARALPRMSGLDLSSWRLALNGSEPIDPAVVERFCAAGAPHGLDPRAAFCVFGMAEATLAVTFPPLFGGMATDAVDRLTLEKEGAAVPADTDAATTRRLPRLGRPVGDLEVRVVDHESPTPRPRPDREVGELQIRGSSVTPGYFNNPNATAEAFTPDGWLRTGDLAYLADGDLVVCGRSKDVIIVGGRNIYPEDVEGAVGEVAGVRAGNVIAFGVGSERGREGLVVVAETREEDADALRRVVAERVRGSVGMPARDVVLVGPGSLPKTSSGKLQRALCRERYLGAELQPA